MLKLAFSAGRVRTTGSYPVRSVSSDSKAGLFEDRTIRVLFQANRGQPRHFDSLVKSPSEPVHPTTSNESLAESPPSFDEVHVQTVLKPAYERLGIYRIGRPIPGTNFRPTPAQATIAASLLKADDPTTPGGKIGFVTSSGWPGNSEAVIAALLREKSESNEQRQKPVLLVTTDALASAWKTRITRSSNGLLSSAIYPGASDHALSKVAFELSYTKLCQYDVIICTTQDIKVTDMRSRIDDRMTSAFGSIRHAFKLPDASEPSKTPVNMSESMNRTHWRRIISELDRTLYRPHEHCDPAPVWYLQYKPVRSSLHDTDSTVLPEADQTVISSCVEAAEVDTAMQMQQETRQRPIISIGKQEPSLQERKLDAEKLQLVEVLSKLHGIQEQRKAARKVKDEMKKVIVFPS